MKKLVLITVLLFANIAKADLYSECSLIGATDSRSIPETINLDLASDEWFFGVNGKRHNNFEIDDQYPIVNVYYTIGEAPQSAQFDLKNCDSLGEGTATFKSKNNTGIYTCVCAED